MVLMAAQTISFPRPIVNVWSRLVSFCSVCVLQARDRTYHAMAFVLRIGSEDAVCR